MEGFLVPAIYNYFLATGYGCFECYNREGQLRFPVTSNSTAIILASAISNTDAGTMAAPRIILLRFLGLHLREYGA